MVFDGLRKSFDELLSRATRPEDRRAAASRMKDTLVQARMGLDDLRDGLAKARAQLAAEERELETVRRRKQLAEGIHDRETVDIAGKYEQMHSERVDVLRRKVAAQEEEVSLGARDVEEMSGELKRVLSGVGAPAAGAAAVGGGALAEEETGADGGGLRDELDSLGRARVRADREADAARRLEELKRRMGK